MLFLRISAVICMKLMRKLKSFPGFSVCCLNTLNVFFCVVNFQLSGKLKDAVQFTKRFSFNWMCDAGYRSPRNIGLSYGVMSQWLLLLKIFWNLIREDYFALSPWMMQLTLMYSIACVLWHIYISLSLSFLPHSHIVCIFFAR